MTNMRHATLRVVVAILCGYSFSNVATAKMRPAPEHSVVSGVCDPGTDEVTLYMNINYGGQCVIKGVGDYLNSTSIALDSNSILSIKVGETVKVNLCQDDDYGEVCELFTADDADLRDNTVGNSQVSSLRVDCNPNSFQVALYVDANYSGQCVTKSVGDYPDSESIGLPNDSISSVLVGGNSVVELCQHNDYGGTCTTLNSNDPNLTDNSIGNDRVSSISIRTIYRIYLPQVQVQ